VRSRSPSPPFPAEDDQVVEESGAQVFLEPHAAEALDDKVLDAEIERGEVRFAVGEQTLRIARTAMLAMTSNAAVP
jgi:hypothetical protein